MVIISPENKIKFIIFDLGGVLIKIHPEKFYKKIINNSNITIDKLKEFKEIITLGYKKPEDIFKELKQNYKINLTIDDIIESFARDYIGEKIPKMEKLLNELCNNNYKLCVLSNINSLHFNYIKPKFNNFKIFYKIYLSYKLHLIKPDPKIFKYVINDLKAQPNEILFIDDSEENIKASCSLGMNTIKVITNNPLSGTEQNFINFSEI